MSKEYVETSIRPEAGRKGARETKDDVVTEMGEKPALPNSRLGLGDLRHSLQVHKESLHREQDRSKGSDVRAPSGVSMAPES